MDTQKVLIINGLVAYDNSKVNWPDMNYPGTMATFLRTVYKINYESLTVQMDDENGPVFNQKTLPLNTGFYTKVN